MLVSGSRIVIDEISKRVGCTHEKAPHMVLRWRLLFGNPVNQPSCMFRVGAARLVGGYLPVSYLEDWDLFARLSELGQIVHVDVPLVMYRVHPSNTGLSAGADRERLEPVATQIMCCTVKAATGLTVPPELVWYLFRGRHVFRGNRSESQKALNFVLQAQRQFVQQNGIDSQSVALGAAVLDDAANVLRCGGWSPWRVFQALIAIVFCANICCLLSPAFLKRTVKVLLIPITVRRHLSNIGT